MRQLTKAAYFLTLATASIAEPLIAEETSSGEPNTVIDQFHRDMSDRLTDFIGQLDVFFSNDESLRNVNQSWLRLRLQGAYLEKEDIDWKANVKFKLVLPNTEKRLRLLLSTDDRDTQVGGTSRIVEEAEEGSNDVAFALRFLRKAVRNQSIKFDLGARIRDQKALVFGRVGGFARKQLNDRWSGTLSTNMIFYSDSDYDFELKGQFERPIKYHREVRFLSSNRVVWERGLKGAVIRPAAGFYTEYNEKTSIAFEGLLSYATSPDPGDKRFQGATLRMRLRQNALRDWFFYELWPSVNWSSKNDYGTAYGIMMRAEAVFGRYGK